MLNYVVHGAADSVPLVVAHGLYGSARNWGVVAKRLADVRQVVAVDMRNHGESPWFEGHSYEEMAGDLAEVIAAFGGKADVLGHSMGGKAAMVLALSQPELVERLLVADIAPVAYKHSQIQYIEAMRGVDLSGVTRRSDADAGLAADVDDPALRAFLLQSLSVGPEGARWKLNLDVLARDMPGIIGFPEVSGSFEGQVSFISGGASEYVQPAHHSHIREFFPNAAFEVLPGVGHWVHAEAPRDFEAEVRRALMR